MEAIITLSVSCVTPYDNFLNLEGWTVYGADIMGGVALMAHRKLFLLIPSSNTCPNLEKTLGLAFTR